MVTGRRWFIQADLPTDEGKTESRSHAMLRLGSGNRARQYTSVLGALAWGSDVLSSPNLPALIVTKMSCLRVTEREETI